MDTALSLYDLENFEMLWDKTHDTKAILGWSSDTVVIAFRGTASISNVLADLQARCFLYWDALKCINICHLLPEGVKMKPCSYRPPGTALQVWRKKWPRDVGNSLLCTAPMVHQGFWASYVTNGFNDRLTNRLEQIIARCTDAQKGGGDGKKVKVYITGHR